MAEATRSWFRATMATGSGRRRFRAAGFTPTSCRSASAPCVVVALLTSPRTLRGEVTALFARRASSGIQANSIADADRAAGDHFRLDPTLVVAQAAHQRGRGAEVTPPGLRVATHRG